jgi:2',3'-cyclic-nucleotide 2'-phosphodiesterase/3'-nucleotidase
VSRPIGTLKETISSRDAFFGSSAFVDLIHQVQLDISGADISFAAPLSMDIEIPAGEITVDDMFDLYRYENLLYTMTLSGQEILDYLNFSYSGWFETMKSKEDHLLKFTEDNSGRLRTSRAFYNFDSAHGIKYTVDVSKPSGQMIEIISMANGEDFDITRTYTIALNSYRGNGGGNHLTEGAGISSGELQGRIVNSTDKDLRYYMMKWIEEKGTIDPKPSGHWKIIPEDYYLAGRNRDYPMLFRN